ncbi:MAG: chromosomal replication initiator protein DnaA [Phycisphaerae bacterium]
MKVNMEMTGESLRADGAEMEAQIRSALLDRIGPKKYNAWFKHGTCLRVRDDKVCLSVPNPFVAGWIETHYCRDLAAAAGDFAGENCHVMVSVDPELCNDLRKRQLDDQAEIVSRQRSGRVRGNRQSVCSPLRHKLQDFVVGDSNKLAYSAAMAVCTTGRAPFNPLFVHGPCGVGKTHLLHGICSKLAGMSRPDGGPIRWKYVTAEAFTNEFVASLRARKLDEFRARYRNLDLLAIDDVHFLAAKRATQDEFLHTFNAIAGGGNQIVLASDTHPRLVGDLNEQLISRFMAGMVVKIESPDRATRMQILRRWSDRLGLDIDEDVIEYLAGQTRGSVRELEGMLVKLSAVAALDGGHISLQLARQTLSDHLARTDSAVALGDIETIVASYFGVTPADIHSSRRTRTVSLARAVTMYLARKYTHMSFPEIGRAIGKNHSSVVLGAQKVQQALEADEDFSWPSPAGKKNLSARTVIDLLCQQIG